VNRGIDISKSSHRGGCQNTSPNVIDHSDFYSVGLKQLFKIFIDDFILLV